MSLLTVYGFAHRNLRRCNHYKTINQDDSEFISFRSMFQHHYGNLIGIYKNTGDFSDKPVHVTDTGIFAEFEGEQRFIRYTEILHVPYEKDFYIDFVMILLKSGEITWFVVNGKYDPHLTHDKFLMRMFIEGAMMATRGT